MVLLEGPVRVGRLLERERAGDMNLEGTSLDESIELVDDLAVRFAVVGHDLHTGPRLRLGLYAVGMGDASAIADRRERLIGGLTAGRDQRGIHATGSERSSGGG